jgi:aerobic carbon-monoxide dehydrogenase small subunit
VKVRAVRQRVVLSTNGKASEHQVEPRLLLVEYLRDVLGLTGTHVGCDTSHCGACTVLFDGESVKSCSILAVQADSHEVTTIEGVGNDTQLSVVQQAFWDCNALQCGYCTPGFIMATIQLLRSCPTPTDEDILTGLEGNICRCTGYVNIVRAVKAAAAATSA